MNSKIPVGVLGATGAVGQRFLERLADHPWFEVAALAASDRSQGKPYGEAVHWRLRSRLPDRLAGLPVHSATAELPCRLFFSALDAAAAREVEPLQASRGALVFSNASAFRMEEDVPLLVPEINPEALCLVERQRHERKWKGALVTNANCSTIFLAMALAPLDRAFSLDRVFAVTLQAVSGAGYPGVPSLDILGNVIPDIPGEAGKIETELSKILGRQAGSSPLRVSAMTHRVPVEDGHLEAVSAGFSRRPSADEVEAAWEEFRGCGEVRELPSAPDRPVLYWKQPGRPQPRPDVEIADGMVAQVGGLKPCALLDWKFTVLGHNTIRGAAGASILNAELAVAKGLL